MTPFLFRCPLTRMLVQALSTEAPPADADEKAGKSYVSVECLSCGGVHMVDPITGKVLGHDDG
jgi:hypothetical protein